ncbi:hypothetical protein LguiB_010031 [Lonicera macranthoides]
MYNRKVENACFEKEGSRWHVVVKYEVTGGAEEYMASYLEVVTGENSQDVLVVGYGNSGMEIAYDLSSWDARTSIVVHSLYIQNYEDTIDIVDNIRVMLSKLKYGDLTGYGLERPTRGPVFLKKITGRSPVIDVGTIDKIKDGSIQNGLFGISNDAQNIADDIKKALE